MLLGDAAHAVHPLAGQGVNLGLRDVVELRDTLVAARDAGRDIGAAHVLRRYARRRRSADTLDALGFDALARIYAWQSPPLVAARGLGVRLLDRLAPLKRRLVGARRADSEFSSRVRRRSTNPHVEEAVMRIARLCCLLLLAGSSLAAQAKMVHRPVEWNLDGTRFHSVLVYDDAGTAKRPGLVMVPNWYGINEAAVKKAEMIAGSDYVIL